MKDGDNCWPRQASQCCSDSGRGVERFRPPADVTKRVQCSPRTIMENNVGVGVYFQETGEQGALTVKCHPQCPAPCPFSHRARPSRSAAAAALSPLSFSRS